MSMNKTCPISNFTSKEDSVGRGFPSILSLAVVVLFQSNLFQNSLEARLLPHAVVNRLYREIPAGALLILIRLVQPIQRLLLFAEPQIDHSERCRTDVLPFCHLFEFAQHLLGFQSISRNGISVAEESLIPRTGHHYLTSLKFRDCSRRVTFPQEAAA